MKMKPYQHLNKEKYSHLSKKMKLNNMVKDRRSLFQGVLNEMHKKAPKVTKSQSLNKGNSCPLMIDKSCSIVPAEQSFPIVKIDRTTAQDLLSIFAEKAIFSGCNNLPMKENILEKEKLKLNKTDLSYHEQRNALAKAKRYKDGHWVISDYGDKAIGFDMRLYQDFIKETENQIGNQLSPYSNEYDEQAEMAIKRVRLFVLAHKLAYIILAEVFSQKNVMQ